MSNVLLARYGFTKGYDWIGLKVVYGISKLVDAMDRRVIDGLINWISRGLVKAGSFLRRGQTGLVQSYAAVIVAGVSLIVILLFLIGGVI
jgi:NADH:ubiquinone oxidoreductase subunit 5 (subunit L)/multisubunit Na+/H+ antiporter MnhA subunit